MIISQLSVHIRKPVRVFMLALLLSSAFLQGHSQTPVSMTIPAGSFIINMGIVPQTVANGLKPYGLVYALLNLQCPVYWVINTSKFKDGTDFSYNGVDYKGGTFIIDAQYRTPAVNTLISTWQGFGVMGVTNTTPIPNVPLYLTFWHVPRWTMDQQNGKIAIPFFTNAGIPSSAYGGASSTYWDTPAMLDCCDDIFVMPHADPVWSTHRHLLEWNRNTGNGLTDGCKGAIWLGCHAGSALENMFDNITTDGDPIDAGEQTNFLVEKTANAVGAGPWSDPGNSLILWGDHDDGTLPYSFNSVYAADPVAQYMGSTDAAQLNGSEQIYIPAHASNGWRPQTHVLVYDPNHPDAKSFPATPMTHVGALLAYGPGMGVTGNGKVILEAAHNIGGTAPANVAAQRAFFNFSYLVAWEKAVLPSLTGLPDTLYSGNNYNMGYTLSFNTPGSSYSLKSIAWSATCGGTWNTSSSNPTIFTAPTFVSSQKCNLSIMIEDACGRKTFDTHAVTIMCNLRVTTGITNPCSSSPNGGAIEMNFTGGTGPYTYSWIRTNPSGSGSGTLTSAPYKITGLSAGNYTVTATANNGAGCPVTFTVSLTQSPEIVITATPLAPGCNGGSDGALNIVVTGGIPGYTFDWGGGITTQNRSGLMAGTYNLTVTDNNGCTKSTAVEVPQPAAISITPSVTDVTCYGLNNGIVNLSVTGGTSPYNYLWNDGNSSQNRTGLAPGTYSVTVTDSHNCIATYNNITVDQPDAALSLSETDQDILCYGNSTGSIDLTVSGGTQFPAPAEPYQVAWTKTGGGYSASTQDIGSLAAGTYNVTVTDYKGCKAALSVEITEPPALVLSTTKTYPTCPPDADQNNADGAITLTVNGGSGGYTFDWSNLGTPGVFTDPQNQSNLMAGTYTVVVKDANNCQATTSVTLNYLHPNPAQPAEILH
jgi:hypothetical protein